MCVTASSWIELLCLSSVSRPSHLLCGSTLARDWLAARRATVRPLLYPRPSQYTSYTPTPSAAEAPESPVARYSISVRLMYRKDIILLTCYIGITRTNANQRAPRTAIHEPPPQNESTTSSFCLFSVPSPRPNHIQAIAQSSQGRLQYRLDLGPMYSTCAIETANTCSLFGPRDGITRQPMPKPEC